MAKDTDVVNPEPTIEEQPTPQIEGAPAGQPLDPASDSGVTLEDVLASPKLQDYIDKKVKQQQDVRLGKYGTRLDILEEGSIDKYEALKEQGMTKEQARAKMQDEKERGEMRAQLDSLLGGNVVAPSPGGGEQLLTEKQASILSDVGLTASDPRFTQFLRDNPKFKTNEEYFTALDKQALDWQSDDAKKPQPSGTSVAQVVPAVPAGDGSYTAEKYTTDMLAARGDKAKLQQIKAAAKADGVDVDNIGFK